MPYRLPQLVTSGCSPVSALAHWPAGRLFLLVTLLPLLMTYASAKWVPSSL